MTADELRDAARMYWRLDVRLALTIRHLVASAQGTALAVYEVAPDGATMIQNPEGTRRVAFEVFPVTTHIYRKHSWTARIRQEQRRHEGERAGRRTNYDPAQEDDRLALLENSRSSTDSAITSASGSPTSPSAGRGRRPAMHLRDQVTKRTDGQYLPP